MRARAQTSTASNLDLGMPPDALGALQEPPSVLLVVCSCRFALARGDRPAGAEEPCSKRCRAACNACAMHAQLVEEQCGGYKDSKACLTRGQSHPGDGCPLRSWQWPQRWGGSGKGTVHAFHRTADTCHDVPNNMRRLQSNSALMVILKGGQFGGWGPCTGDGARVRSVPRLYWAAAGTAWKHTLGTTSGLWCGLERRGEVVRLEEQKQSGREQAESLTQHWRPPIPSALATPPPHHFHAGTPSQSRSNQQGAEASFPTDCEELVCDGEGFVGRIVRQGT